MAKKTFGASMVAPHPPADGKLHPVVDLADREGLMFGELAGLMRFKGWAAGKHATEADFAEALGQYRSKVMGNGRN